MKSKLIQNNNITVNGIAPPVSEIKSLLESSRKVIVASHIDPDGDALGTQLAFASYLKILGKSVYLVRDNSIPEKYKFLEGINDIPHVNSYSENICFDTAVILECPDIKRTGRISSFFNDDIKIINIDHHRDNNEFGVVNWINTAASSVGEMTFEYFEKVNVNINKSMAEHLYTAIMTDTGRFRYKSTSPRTMEIAGILIKAGAEPQKICDLVYFNLQPSTMKLIGKVLNGIEYYLDGQICLLTLTNEMLVQSEAKPSDSDGLVDYTLFKAGVKAGALIKETDDNNLTKVSFRSKDGINVAEIAGRFGGGGHFNASGCAVKMSMKMTKVELLKILCEAIEGKNE